MQRRLKIKNHYVDPGKELRANTITALTKAQTHVQVGQASNFMQNKNMQEKK